MKEKNVTQCFKREWLLRTGDGFSIEHNAPPVAVLKENVGK